MSFAVLLIVCTGVRARVGWSLGISCCTDYINPLVRSLCVVCVSVCVCISFSVSGCTTYCNILNVFNIVFL